MPERKLVAVFLVTENVDMLVPFYRDIVGLKLTQYEPGHSAWFDTGAVSIAIHRPESEHGNEHDLVPNTATLIWFQPGEGVSAAADAIAGARVDVLRPVGAQNYFFLKDPEGRIVGMHSQPQSQNNSQ